MVCVSAFFFFQAEDGIRDVAVTGVQTCALPISRGGRLPPGWRGAICCWRGCSRRCCCPGSYGRWRRPTPSPSGRGARAPGTGEGRGGEEGRTPGAAGHLKKKKKKHDARAVQLNK